ncbi:MAG: hypothetical protein GWP08_07165 [Nitrospiraceae bacterium]|nr:hypothetical protein [Nitrospiraceae bacterium]
MPSEVAKELRIYCICGQKMKVSETMFGLPGKCVACRQKIRVPSLEELPDDCAVVYLKDHPEFLRRGRRRSGDEPKDAEQEDTTLDRADEAVNVTILDILEPLRVLCSLEYKIQRQLASAEREEAGGDPEDTAALEGYLDRVQSARAEMDEQLRQRLMEAAIDLSGAQEKILQAGLSARIGEIEFVAFWDMVDKLRRRRESLERLQQNLRGWLTVSDPHMAGGYTNVSLDSIPSDGFVLTLPPEFDDPRSLLDQHIEGLREAFLRCERAEMRLGEMERLAKEGNMPSLVLEDCTGDCTAEKMRAEAEIGFRRARLEELSRDAANDVKTIQACLDQASGRFKAGGLERSRFMPLQRDLVRAQRDCAKAHDVLSRALIASTADDVPQPKGTFLRRMARPGTALKARIAVDQWVAWGSALIAGLSVFLPLVDKLSPIGAYQSLSLGGQFGHWVMIMPVLAGGLVALATAVSNRRLRGIAFCVMWLLFTIVGALVIHQAAYGTSLISVRFRQGGSWLWRPGMLALLVAHLGLLAAAGMALFKTKRLRPVVPVVAAAGLLLTLAISTDFGGLFFPKPSLAVSYVDPANESNPVYPTSILLRNGGGRSILLASAGSSARNAFTYTLERADGAGWDNVGAPRRIESKNGRGLISRNEVRGLRVPAGEDVAFQYHLAPGDYRVRLVQSVGEIPPLASSFSLAAPAVAMARAPDLSTLPAPPPPAPEPAPPAPEPEPVAPETRIAAAPDPTGVSVELRGTVAGDENPRFLMMLHMPDGTTRELDVALEDALYDPWTVNEFDPDRKTVTIGRDGRVLILKRGKRVSLD